MKATRTVYQVYSPDGIAIAPATYPSRAAAYKALAQWVERFKAQGYYRTANWSKIDVLDLPDYCTITNA